MARTTLALSLIHISRTEGPITGAPELEETIRRLTAFAKAGADCLYAPALRDLAHIAEVVAAVAPKPVNVLTGGLSVATLAGLGVRRISVGGGLARTAWGEDVYKRQLSNVFKLENSAGRAGPGVDPPVRSAIVPK